MLNATLLILVLGLLWASNAALAIGAEQSKPSVETGLTYSAGYRVTGMRTQNILHLGVVTACGAHWCLRFRRYEGALNLPRSFTAQWHAMDPGKSLKCEDSRIGTVNGEMVGPIQGDFLFSEKYAEFRGGGYKIEWVADITVPGSYLLKSLTDEKESKYIDQAVGYAFSRVVRQDGPIQSEKQFRKYSGEIFHKNMKTRVEDAWEYKSSTLDMRRFSSSGDLGVFHLTVPGSENATRHARRKVFVHHSFSVYYEYSTLTPLVHEYGHDFNANGCFDEPGHTKLLLPASVRDIIDGFVYIEYSADVLDGIPMISVGRYY